MNSYEKFVHEREEIGAGMAATVYSYNGYAYKCFNEDYPIDWIDYEVNLQHEVVKSGLPIPKYYRSEFPGSIKMDLIKGESMADRIAIDGKNAVMNEMMKYFRKVHDVKDMKLHSLQKWLLKGVNSSPTSNEIKMLANQYYLEVDEAIREDEVLCHLDYHFLNLMQASDGVHIIDWVNAKNGKAIWDYARTYVIIYEYAAGMKNRYLSAVLRQERYPKDVFLKAVYVSAVYRLNESNSKRVKKLINEVFTL